MQIALWIVGGLIILILFMGLGAVTMTLALKRGLESRHDHQTKNDEQEPDVQS